MIRIYLGLLMLTAGVYASIMAESQEWVIYALFVIGIVSVVFLYIVSRQNTKTQSMYKKMLEQQDEIEKKQSEFLHSIGEEIHTIVEDTYEQVTKYREECLPDEVLEQERTLRHVTGDLIEFLRLKSKKVTVNKERFNLNNVLNEVAGSLQSEFSKSDVELIFDIDNTIPRYLMGDPLHLEKVLKYTIEFMLLNLEHGEIQLSIETYATYNETTKIDFKFQDNGKGFEKNESAQLFIPEYDEKNKMYRRLGLYVAHTLTQLMGGVMDVYSQRGKGTTFTLTMPFELVDRDDRRYYRLPEKILTKKNVLIVDQHPNSAYSIKKLFTYFKHDVNVMTADVFSSKKQKLDAYDLLILDESLFSHKQLVNYLSQVKSSHEELKIVATRSLFTHGKEEKASKFVDKTLVKPLTQERVFELIIDLYSPKRDNVFEDYSQVLQSPVYKEPVKPARYINYRSFADFGGASILIAEDDEINRKVIANILKYSGMNLTFVPNGKEAVRVLKESDDSFDLVLMDINMPVIDGYIATQMIRLESQFDALPVIAFTALSLESEREKIFRSGMNAYLTKPIDIGQLYAILKLYLPVNSSDKKLWKEMEIISNETIDMKRGIVNVNGNEGLYMELLQEFIDAYGTSDVLFKKLITERRFEQAKMLCMDLKGMSNAIGATELFHVMVRIHQKLLQPDYNELLVEAEDMQKYFSKLRLTIEQYLNH